MCAASVSGLQHEVLPLAGRGVVCGFSAQLGGRRLAGAVREKGAARQQYAEARDSGTQTALGEVTDDLFRISIGSLGPGDTATVEAPATPIR